MFSHESSYMCHIVACNSSIAHCYTLFTHLKLVYIYIYYSLSSSVIASKSLCLASNKFRNSSIVKNVFTSCIMDVRYFCCYIGIFNFASTSITMCPDVQWITYPSVASYLMWLSSLMKWLILVRSLYRRLRAISFIINDNESVMYFGGCSVAKHLSWFSAWRIYVFDFIPMECAWHSVSIALNVRRVHRLLTITIGQ